MSIVGNCRMMMFFPIFLRSLLVILLVLLLFFTPTSTSSCPPSSCGDVKVVKYPFRLKTDPESCRRQVSQSFVLDCQNNQTIFNANSKRYLVKEINYKRHRIRLADPGINRGNFSSCPLSSYGPYDWRMADTRTFYELFSLNHFSIVFTHCLSPADSVKYVKAPFCGNKSNIFVNSFKVDSFVFVIGGKENRALFDLDKVLGDLEENCTVDELVLVSARAPIITGDNYSLANIYDALAYGFELSWDPPGNPFSLWIFVIDTMKRIATLIVGLAFVKFLIGFPLMIWLVVHTWRRRHFSMDKVIEDFLQEHHNLGPIRYSYSEIKKMTNNFTLKLGEGGYGTVYRGKLRSGPYVAIKMMEQSIVTEEEFINEVGTIGQIHHVNIVQLIGFCVESSKYALVYEFLPNGSLDRYIFNQQSLSLLALGLDNLFEIALGVARGIDYLHCGCNMRILHFDIKPHNILLDEKFHPKISDFGLAQLHSIDNSFVNLTTARGTMGYMAPELFYKNFGGISYKADVYSFGMMLMEMVGRRKNVNPFIEDMSQLHFPSWVYDHLCIGNGIDIKDVSEIERLMVKKIIITALWCIQMRPSDRPSMGKVIKMLEGDSEPEMPPKPFIAPHEVATNDNEITRTYNVDYIHLDLT